jgi:4-amino-4-deoxy-L-arabinose transferase-like glycosyltransferase
MAFTDLLDSLAARGRGPMLAAALMLLTGLAGLFTLPPTDRDESRFAEASAQMLESGDYTTIMFQDEPRFKKPVGIYWLQALSVSALSSAERREIFAYRIPSLLGAALAAAATVWGAQAFLPAWAALTAGVLMAATTALSTEANLATTDGALCGAVTLALAAMGRLYLASRGGPPAGRKTKLLFWLGLSASVLLKGPIGPMVAGLTALSLAVWDRRADWLKGLGWSWGLILLAGVVLPWALAITVATDGAFWGIAVGGDLAPKLLGGQEGHGAPPGYYLLLSTVLLFPAILLAPAGLVRGWRDRASPSVRFALCWLVPSWLVFELVPTKLPHYTLPTFGALAWLMAGALTGAIGDWTRKLGALLSIIGAVGFIGLALVAAYVFGDAWSWAFAILAAILYAAAGGGGAVMLLRRRETAGVVIASVLALLGHGMVIGALAPSLKGLWLSEHAAQALERAGSAPVQGLAASPVTVAGYGEPSIVFALGARTQLAWGADAAHAIAEGRPAIVEAAEEPAFRKGLAANSATARAVGAVAGLDYSNGQRQILKLYEPQSDAPKPKVAPS